MNAGAEGISSEARLSAGSIVHLSRRVAPFGFVALADARIPPQAGLRGRLSAPAFMPGFGKGRSRIVQRTSRTGH
jgi:hypothetical protein